MSSNCKTDDLISILLSNLFCFSMPLSPIFVLTGHTFFMSPASGYVHMPKTSHYYITNKISVRKDICQTTALTSPFFSASLYRSAISLMAPSVPK